MIVASKFDNRLKEFAERWEVDKYLSATGYLPANVKPFFIALPKVSMYMGAAFVVWPAFLTQPSLVSSCSQPGSSWHLLEHMRVDKASQAGLPA